MQAFGFWAARFGFSVLGRRVCRAGDGEDKGQGVSVEVSEFPAWGKASRADFVHNWI